MSGVRYSVDPRGGLRVASARDERTVALSLRADAAEASYPTCESLALPWKAYGKVRDHFGGEPPDADAIDGWRITGWSLSGAVYGGIAVEVSGWLRALSLELRDETVTRWRRVTHALSDGPPVANLVPVVMPATVVGLHQVSADLSNLAALAGLLAKNPDYLARLDDRDRVRRLAADLSDARFVPRVADNGSIRRDATDVVVALQYAGFVHRTHGRPLSSAHIAPPDVVLAGVRRSLAANPYRKGRPMVDDETIMRIAKRSYLDVEPWPFAALVD